MLCRHFFPALLTICFVTAPLRAGNAISFDFDPATDNGQADYFLQTDLAGAPGERVAHWNTLSYGDSNGVFTLNSIHDSTGTTISGMTLTTGATGTRSPSIGFSSSNTSEYGGSHAAYGNDSKFFDHFLDYTSNSPVSITVTNIPFTVYSVVFYRSDQENSNPSSNATAASGYVGGFTIGSKTEYVRGGPAVSSSVVPYSNTPDSTGSPYIISSDTTNKASSYRARQYGRLCKPGIIHTDRQHLRR